MSDFSASSDFVYSAKMFTDAHQQPSVGVPICRATADSLAGYGRLVYDYDRETVENVTWPKPSGWRLIADGTGNKQALVEGDFVLRWEGDIIFADNIAVGEVGVGFATGRLSEDGRYVLVRDANYHPDGGQLFFPPSDGSPFIMLMAPSSLGDDVTPQDFRAFWFDGRHGFQIAPGVWHQSPYTLPPGMKDHDLELSTTITSKKTIFRNKQSSVFACVLIDTMKEFGVFMKVPLYLEGDD